MAYTQITQANLAQEIAVSLQDPNYVYWSQDEVFRAINEGLLYWGALTSYWRERGSFSSAASAPLYNIATNLPTLRARTYTLGDLTKESQYHLLEPANGVSGSGMTDQFTIGQLTSVLTRKRNELVIDTRLPLSFDTIPVPYTPSGILELDQSICASSRASWRDLTSGAISPLSVEDTWSAQSYNPLWTLTPGLPFAYSVAETMPLQVQFIPPPSAAGAFNLIYAQTITMAIADGTLLAVPNEFAAAIKWASIYELLGTNSQGYDPMRSQYCLERYSAYVQASALHRSVMRVYRDGVPLPVDTFQALDSSRPYWQNNYGTPKFAATAYDIIGLSDVPSSAAFSISCDVVRSAPLPAVTTDYIQLGREEIPYLFDYCRHILSFKMGGSDFQSTMQLYDNFLSGAKQRNKLIVDKVRYLTPLFGQQHRESSLEPVS